MTITLIHNILSGNFRANRKTPETRSPLVSQVSLEVNVALYVFLVFFLSIDTMGNFTFPRTKTAKSVGHFLKPLSLSVPISSVRSAYRGHWPQPLFQACVCIHVEIKMTRGIKQTEWTGWRPVGLFTKTSGIFTTRGMWSVGFFLIVSNQAQVGLWLTHYQVSGLLSDFYSSLCYSSFFSLLSQVGFLSDHSTKVESKYKYVNCHSLSSVFWWPCDVAFSYPFFYHFPGGLGKMITISATDLSSSSTIEVALWR